MIRLASIGAMAAFAVGVSAFPAFAQEEAGDRVNMVIAYAEDECPEPVDAEEIVVCQILVEAERYRIPSTLRTSSSPENTAWAERVERFKMIGDFGTLSCSPTGAGGFTGCTQQMIDAAYADKDESTRVRFSQLIQEAREDRLSTIDADAAAEQERVEQIEREYLDRLERERQAPLPGEDEEASLPSLGPTDGEPAPAQQDNSQPENN
ncbi:hypothetical protein BPTFM16_02148 [Altererythrobacter insulae]|nr:hypothetical protein BPTFM16_02148 [Altererythrobacter insulae]